MASSDSENYQKPGGLRLPGWLRWPSSLPGPHALCRPFAELTNWTKQCSCQPEVRQNTCQNRFKRNIQRLQYTTILRGSQTSGQLDNINYEYKPTITRVWIMGTHACTNGCYCCATPPWPCHPTPPDGSTGQFNSCNSMHSVQSIQFHCFNSYR